MRNRTFAVEQFAGAKRDNLRSDFNYQAFKRGNFGKARFKNDIAELRISLQRRLVMVGRGSLSCHRSVDSFRPNENSANQSQLGAQGPVFLRKALRVA